MKSNVALIGFMGTGKSTVGKLLAQKLKMHFTETDSLIEDLAGKPIAEIFRTQGEFGFRKLEADIITKIADSRRTVISCGGGIVLNPSNIEQLKTNSLVVYLHAEPASILHRVLQSNEVRPLLEVEDPAKTIDDLMKFRRPLYEQSADLTVDTTDMIPEEVVSDIMAELFKNESVNF